MQEPLHITMLGEFSICMGQNSIHDSNNRMRKVWLLLAYLIYTRNSKVNQNQFLELMQGGNAAEAEDPSGRLKALFYRARTQLNQLGDGMGHELILFQNGKYAWNAQIPLELDVEVFDRLYQAAAQEQSDEQKLELYMQALSLYRGDFLPKLSTEHWAMPISAYYHQMYLDGACQALALLTAQGRWQEAADLCDRALAIEPYGENIYQQKMRCCIALNRRADAVATFEKMSELLFDMFGVMPPEESRQLYREATRESNDAAVSMSTIQEQLREPQSVKGALFCEFDFFRLLYQAKARAMIRSGDVVHIALLSCQSQTQKPLSRRSLDTAMDNLQVLLLDNLRQGDVVTRCSVSQLCCMLPNANYENSCAVCQRIIKAFNRQYPHSPVQLHFRVQPLEPASQENDRQGSMPR